MQRAAAIVTVGLLIVGGCGGSGSGLDSTTAAPHQSSTTVTPDDLTPPSSIVTPVTTTTTTLSPEDGLVPSDFDVGPELAAEVRSELPPHYFRLGFTNSVILLAIDGTPLGHLRGVTEPPLTGYERTQLLTEALIEEWPIPDNCQVDGELSDDQLRILCVSDGDGPDTDPTVEVLSRDGSLTVVGALPPPPSGLESAFRTGHFVEVMPSPWNRSASLAQYSAECETQLALMIRDGEAQHVDGTRWRDGAYPQGASIALGWGPDQRALVWRYNSPCSEPLNWTGVYIYDIQGYSVPLFRTPDETQWIQFVTPDPATDLAAIYPVRTSSELEALLLSETPLPQDNEVVTSFARDVLGMAEPVVAGIADGTDSALWTTTAGDIEARVGTRIIAWRADGTSVVAVTHASTVDHDDEWYLTAQV
ncbi:MAG: hypothetical protein KJO18_06425, partial [Acidimicrobiia bacterium]|nr:hypothetical protein [Acidimicrobiia bacterium]